MDHVYRFHSLHRLAAGVLAGLLLGSAPLIAGNGKITGRVKDNQTGEPLIGVNVVIIQSVLQGGKEVPMDRPLGASTDKDGYYFILNVPPGLYNVRASMVGYTPETQKQLRVESDRTITLDYQLSATGVQLGDVVVTASRDLVRKDVSTTQEVITTARIEEVPVLRVDEYLGQLKGVQLVSTSDGAGLSVRGGAVRETDVRIDGVSLQDPRSENSYLGGLNSTTIQEMQVLTGGFEAKYGGIRSGLLNVVTRDGQQDRYTASVKVDVAPAHQAHFFGQNPWAWSNESWIYRVYAGEYAMRGTVGDSSVPVELRSFKGWGNLSNKLPAAPLDSNQLLQLWKDQHPDYEVARRPDYYVEGSVTGPFPGGGLPVIGDFADRTTFLLGFKYQNSQLAFPVGPRDNYLDWNTQLKLTSMLSNNMKLAVNGMYASIKTASSGRFSSYGGALVDQTSSFGFLSNTDASSAQQGALLGGDGFFQMYNKSRLQYFDQRYIVGGAKFTHTVSENAFYTVDLQVGYTDQVLKPFAYVADTSNPDLWATYYSARTKRTYRFNLPTLGSPNASTNYGYDPLNVFTIYGGPQRMDSSYSYVYQLRGDFTAQLGRHHQVEGGISARLQNVFVYSGTWYQSELQYTPDTWNYYWATPLEIGIYAQDKLEFEGMTLNAGLRLDYLNPMKESYEVAFPLSDSYAAFYNDVYPSLNGDPGSYERWLEFRGLLGSPPGWPTEPNHVQVYLSPRLGVAFPLTESSKMYFNYGTFYQRPATSFLYNTNLTPGKTTVPTPELDMARTVSYEFGYEQMVTSDILVNVTAYYKDIRGEPLQRTYVNYYGDNLVAKYYPDSYRDIRGIEFRVERPIGQFFTFRGMYDYMLQSRGQSGLQQVFENRLDAKDNEVRSPNITVTDPRPRANLDMTFKTPEDFGAAAGGFMLNFLFEWNAGGRILLNPSEPDVKNWMYADIVNTWNIDFRASKLFRMPYGSIELVLTVKNLTNNKWLNTDNMTLSQYNDYKNSLRTPDKGGNDKWGQYASSDNHINVGAWEAPIFLNPRQLLFGIRLNL